MKLCVFQGTFNPIHNAHLAMANHVKNEYDYDSILFIPAYKPPHKEFDDEMSTHRYQMVKLAVSGQSAFGISNIEFQNERFSYTYFTIEELYKRYKIEGKIGFVIGMDAFREITEWFEADKLKKLVHFIVFPRGTLIALDNDRLSLLRHKGYDFTIAKMAPIQISSTDLREKLESSEPTGASIPLAVTEYIRENGLYKTK
jgi:nicotinate-nucleotide adenylyltransferase